MRNSIIFVLVTFGGILALGLVANKVKSVRGSRTCWVVVPEGAACPAAQEWEGPGKFVEEINTSIGGENLYGG